MERLTTNKDVQEMGMYELAHNCSYYKDGNARYRDFETDVDARDLTRKLLKQYADGDDAFSDEEDFDEEMLELLQYGTDTIEGLIALFYRNLWAMADLRERLKSYEDAEEQGLLLRLPCRYGDTMYWLIDGSIKEVWFKGIRCDKGYKPQIIARYMVNLSAKEDPIAKLENLGKTVFLTREEAEQELANMQQSHAEAIMDERNGR